MSLPQYVLAGACLQECVSVCVGGGAGAALASKSFPSRCSWDMSAARTSLANESSSTRCSWDMSAGCAPLSGCPGRVDTGRRDCIQPHVGGHVVVQSLVPGTDCRQYDLTSSADVVSL